MSDGRLGKVLASIDAANAKDPNAVEIGGIRRPAEAVYGERMSRALARLCSDASEHLQIAARGQHIERWTHPRSSYPMTREGYLRWRTGLKAYHAERLGALMADAGYAASDIDRVRGLIRKQRLKSDAEAQMLEDVVCVVFLQDYFADFASKHDDDKIIGILRKTWAKMSPVGHAAALALDLPAAARAAIERALAAPPSGA